LPPKKEKIEQHGNIGTMDIQDLIPRRPSTYIRLYTLKAIEHRLRFTDMTMPEIANDLNFPNPSFFGKYCKEHLGMTPLEYRMKYHKGT
jgi:AraC-like DNA-binding protein